MADNVERVSGQTVDDFDFYEEEDFEEPSSSVGFFTRLKEALRPRNIISYLVSHLWKPVLAFMLIFLLFLGSVYAAAYYQLVDARNALDFENTVAQMRQSTNPVLEQVMPVVEWTSATMAAAGEMMQTQIDWHLEAVRKQQEEEALLAKQQEQAQQQAQGQNGSAQQQRPQDAQQQQPSTQQRERDRQKQEEELQRLAEERQKEINKRAGKLATYYAGMNPQDAVNIMKELDNDEIVVILNRMDNDTASQILAAFEPSRASTISKDILKLHPAPTTLPPTVQGQGVL